MKLKDTNGFTPLLKMRCGQVTGFTLIELIIIMGIMVILLMIASVNILPIKHKTSLTTSVQALITDIRQQQIKSMSGEGAQGIHFETDSYTLYKGLSYETYDTAVDKFKVNLGDQIQFFSVPTDQQINFATVSGEIIGYNPSKPADYYSFIVKNMSTGEPRTLKFNKFGIFIYVQ